MLEYIRVHRGQTIIRYVDLLISSFGRFHLLNPIEGYISFMDFLKDENPH